MKKAHYEETTLRILGWYDSNIHTSIPLPNIEATDKVWQNSINNNHNKIESDGKTSFYDFRTDVEKAEQLEAEAKKIKKEALANVAVEINQVEYDAHDQALLNMTAVAVVANFTFIKELVKTMPELQPLYDAIYKTQIKWKNYNNGVSEVQIESLHESIHKAMTKRAKIYGAIK